MFRISIESKEIIELFRKISENPNVASVNSIRMPKSTLKNYLARRFNDRMADKILNYLEFPNMLGYASFV